jgi:hypothetical protein
MSFKIIYTDPAFSGIRDGYQFTKGVAQAESLSPSMLASLKAAGYKVEGTQPAPRPVPGEPVDAHPHATDPAAAKPIVRSAEAQEREEEAKIPPNLRRPR